MEVDEGRMVEGGEDDLQFPPPNPANQGLKFRNYVPKDKQLRKNHLRPMPEDLVTIMKDKYTEEIAKENDDELLHEARNESNWDLKRELSERVTILEASTHAALASLLRSKIANTSQ